MPAVPFYQSDSLNVATYDDRISIEGTSVDGDVDFFVDFARESGGPLLELGAGTGRVAWALAEEGFDVVGVELSPAMRARAEAKRTSMPALVAGRAQFVTGDMSDFDLGRTFPLVLVPYRGFQALLTVEQQRCCLAAIRRHLAEGGRAVFDLFDPRLDLCLPGTTEASCLQAVVSHPSSGNEVRVETVTRTNDAVAQTLSELWRFTELDPAGNVVGEEEEMLALRWTYRWEMHHLFELEKLRVVAEYSDFSGSPPAYGREQVWIVEAG